MLHLRLFKKNLVPFIGALVLISFSLPSQAAEIHLGQGILPPYGIKETDSGIEVDIVRAALAKKGHTVRVRFVPFGRVGQDLTDGKIDAASTLTASSGVKAEYSDSHIAYQNVATTLKDGGPAVGSVGDLGSLRVVAFRNASIYLGDEFAAMSKGNKSYREVGDQAAQNKLLMTGRTDAVVGDFRIFLYYNKQIASQIEIKEVMFNKIFPPTEYSVGFKDASIRDDFNAGLKEIRSSGEYDKIIAKYVEN
ncbi:MAG: transporter substrate-binding domain-containing protein [Sneathiella sp.]|nr:transporter substrate-binding domain-containing protein [Sneathiella sp.]